MRLAALPLVGVLVAASAAAADPGQVGRYVFVPVETGTLRLDTATGAVSLCTVTSGESACKRMPDEARDGAQDISELRDRLAAAEARIAALEQQSRTSLLLSDEKSLERVMSLADRMMRHFFGLVQEMRREFDSEEL